MKQIPLDDALRAKLKISVPDVDPEKISIFRAAALSTAPVRKKHPVYFGAVHTANFLAQMMGELKKESRPLQVMHGDSDGDQLPIGRVFHGELSEGTGVDGATELLTLFWIDNTHESLISKVNSGTIDQVSVAILGKSAKSNKTGFDFLGPKADIENIWMGVDDKGNKMGKDGAHVLVDDLDEWFEMSLVGQGGAQGARILNNQLHLSASNQDVPPLVLQLSTGSVTPKPDTSPEPGSIKGMFNMDAAAFAGIIAENATKLANAQNATAAEKTRADAEKVRADALAAELVTLKASATATQVTELTAQVTTLTTERDTARALPKTLLTPLFTNIGKPVFELDADPAKAAVQVQEAVEGVKAIGARLSGGMAPALTAQLSSDGKNANSAFRRRA